MSDDKMPDAKQIKEILDVVSEKVPELLEKVTGALYGADNAKRFAAAVAEFYKSLKAAGMNEEQAYELTKEYMTSLNLGGLMGKAFQGQVSHHGSGHGHKDGYVVYADDEEKCDEEESEGKEKKK
jgi:hypothetical protein